MIFISVHLNILNYRCHYSSQIPSLHAGMPPPPAMPPPPTPCMPPVPTTSMPPPPARSPGFYPFPNIHQTSGVVSHSMESGSDLLVGHHQVFHNDISIAICKLFNKWGEALSLKQPFLTLQESYRIIYEFSDPKSWVQVKEINKTSEFI